MSQIKSRVVCQVSKRTSTFVLCLTKYYRRVRKYVDTKESDERPCDLVVLVYVSRRGIRI